MNRRHLVFLFLIWIANMMHSYYSNVFIQAFIDIFFFTYLAFGTCYHFYKIIQERGSLQSLRLVYFLVFGSLLLLTFVRPYTNRIMEELDWMISKNKRVEIVEQVKLKKLNPDSNLICELPFSFPIISNGGNEILISRSEIDSSVTVGFWVSRSMLDVPSEYFVYTNDKKEIEKIDSQIQKYPKSNWKIEDNWFKITGRFQMYY